MKYSNPPLQSLNLVKHVKSRLKASLLALKLKIKYCSILSVFFMSAAYAEMPDQFSLNDEITEADLIFKGKLIKTFSRSENIISSMLNKNKEIIVQIPSSIYTTYIFSIDEIIKGVYNEETIKVLMLGGCDLEQNLCVDYSFNYHYKVGELAVIFLKKKSNAQDAYKADQGSYSAFSINNNNVLVRKSTELNDTNKHESNLSFENNKIRLTDSLTLQSLKNKVSEWRSQNEE